MLLLRCGQFDFGYLIRVNDVKAIVDVGTNLVETVLLLDFLRLLIREEI